MELDVGFYFAALCVAVYAHERFNTPYSLRYTTTLGQYYFALSGYVMAALLIFGILSWMFEANPTVREFISTMSGGAVLDDDKTNALPTPFVAALLLTILLPKVPVLSSIDTGIQKFFRDLGAIPHRALRLSWRLQRAPYAIPESQMADVKERIGENELDAKAVLKGKEGTPEAELAKVVALKASIDAYRGDNPRFNRQQGRDLTNIEESYKRLMEMAKVVIGGPNRVQTLDQTLRNDCRALLKILCVVTARGLLQTQRSLHGTVAELAEWGFSDLEAERASLSANQIAGAVVGIGLYLLIVFLVVGTRSNTEQVLVMVIVVSMTMGAAVICAFVPKTMTPTFACRDKGGQRPILFYLMAALGAGLAWFLIHFLRLSILAEQDLAGTVEAVLSNRPWMIMPVITAFTLAWMSDNDPSSGAIPRPLYRWIEGTATGLVMAGGMYLVLLWWSYLDPLRYEEVPVLQMSLSGFGIGFLLGYFLPSLYRGLPQHEADLAEQDGVRTVMP